MRGSSSTLLLTLVFSAILAPAILLDTISADGSGIEVLDYYWGRAGEEWAVVPGDRNAKLTVVIQNREDTTICGLKAVIYDVSKGAAYPFRNKDGGNAISSYYEGYVKVGEARSMEFDVSVAPEAKPGYYDVNLYFTYIDCEDPDYPELSTRTKIKLKVWGYPEIEVIDSRWLTQDNSPTYASPGDHAKFLTLTFYVPRYYMVSNVKALLHLPKYFTNLTGGSSTEEFYQGQVLGGQVFTMKFGLNVGRDTPVGLHTLRLTLKYYDRWLSEVEQEIQVPVKVSGFGDLDIDLKGMLISAGSSTNAEIIIKNEGAAPLYSIKSRIVAEGGLIILSEITKEVDILYPGESIVFKPLVFAPPTLPEGSYTLTLTVNYLESSGSQKTETRGIGVYVRRAPEVGLTSYIEGEALTTSKISKVNIVLKNLYNAPITEVKTVISLTGLPIILYSGEQNAYFEEIKPGQQVEIPVELLVSPRAEETVYEGSLTVSYRDPYGQPRAEILSLPFIVRGLIKLSFKQLQLGTSTVYPGAVVDVLGEVLNGGAVTARLTNVKLVLEGPLTPTQYSTYYIGDVSPYSTSSFTLSFRVSDDAKPGRYLLKVIVKAENTYGDEFEDSEELEVNVVEKPPESSTSSGSTTQLFGLKIQQLLPIIIIMAVSIVLLGYLAIRRKKKIEIP